MPAWVAACWSFMCACACVRVVRAVRVRAAVRSARAERACAWLQASCGILVRRRRRDGRVTGSDGVTQIHKSICGSELWRVRVVCVELEDSLWM